ncbi:MAG TPA: Scr1 family TA system antitoxin-like transcriptional regulator [Streptosporangiaceae bacterium]|nr:Scr1 family TA system antitoxin-like transcriptional regulator [Streptosporangiaceae bacterium]
MTRRRLGARSTPPTSAGSARRPPHHRLSDEGRPDVGYLDNALAGQVVERPADVARITLLYDILKAEALSPRASIDLARKAIERWT